MKNKLIKIENILNKININFFSTKFKFLVSPDLKYQIKTKSGELDARIFIQIKYESPCNKTSEIKEWKGSKYYLSEYMTEDEVIKTAFKAFKQAVEHEVLESFKIGSKPLFNPHTPYQALLSTSDIEIVREDNHESFEIFEVPENELKILDNHKN